MIRLVQIATVLLSNFHAHDGGFGLELEAEGDSLPLEGGTGFVLSDDQYKHKARRMQGSATFYDRGDERDQLIRELEYYAGKIVDLIGCIPFPCSQAVQAVWVHTRGRFSLRRRGSGKRNDIQVTLTVDLLYPWQPLNRLMWQFTDQSPFTLTPANLSTIGFAAHEVYSGFFDLANAPLETNTDSTFEVRGGGFTYGAPIVRVYGSPIIGQNHSGLFIGSSNPPSFTVFDFIPVSPGTTYTFSYWYRGVNIANGNTLYTQIFRQDGTLLLQVTGLLVEVGKWKRVTVTFTTDPDQHFVGFTVRKDNVAGQIIWDVAGLSLIEGSTFYDRRIPDYPVSYLSALQTPYPSLDEVMRSRDCRFVPRLVGPEVMLNPDTWPSVVDNLPEDYPSIGSCIRWTEKFIGRRLVYPAHVWNTRPMAVYALRALSPAMLPEVRVMRPGGEVGKARINCEILDDILTSRHSTTLQQGDTLIVGELSGRAVLMRDGTVLAYVSDCLASGGIYDTDAPGGVRGEDFRVGVWPDGAEWSALFLWRAV